MAADETQTPPELVAHWRAVAENMGSYSPTAAGAMRVCADELEAALRPRVLSEAEVARITDGTDVEEWELQAGVDGY